MHDQPHLTFTDGHIEPIEDRWERMVTGTPWVASCTVTVDQELVEVCSGPEAADSLTYGAFGEGGTREFFTHVRFHKHDEDKITIHLLVELYARTAEEAGEVLEEASRGVLVDHLAGRGKPPPRRPSRAKRTSSPRSRTRPRCDTARAEPTCRTLLAEPRLQLLELLCSSAGRRSPKRA